MTRRTRGGRGVRRTRERDPDALTLTTCICTCKRMPPCIAHPTLPDLALFALAITPHLLLSFLRTFLCIGRR